MIGFALDEDSRFIDLALFFAWDLSYRKSKNLFNQNTPILSAEKCPPKKGNFRKRLTCFPELSG